MIRSVLNTWIMVISCGIALFPAMTGAVDNKYVEDFTTIQYCDTLNTTALWDTLAGELKLPPFALVPAGTLTTPGYTMGLVVDGDYVYVADDNSGLHVVDISDPTSPFTAGSCATPGYSYNVAVWGDYAYVADMNGGLRVIDISNPTSPVSAGSCATPGSAMDVVVSGDYAFVADGGSGLVIVDISAPPSPSPVDTLDTPGTACGVAVDGDYAYVTDDATGLVVIDISDPTSASIAGSCATTGSPWWGVAVSGDHAYIADGGGGLQVIDISDPTNPVSAGSFSGATYAYDVVVTGDYAYVADYYAGLVVVDISDPTAPASAGGLAAPFAAYGVAVAGEYAYVADETYGLRVINICDALPPTEAAENYQLNEPRRVTVSGDYAYVADASDGLLVIDISVPTAAFNAGSYNTPNYSWDVAIAGDYAYVADGTAGLQVIDISDPTSPSYAGSYDTSPIYAVGVDVSGDYAYVADGYLGFKVIDISDPTSPSLAANYGSYVEFEYRVAVSGDYAYVANCYDGLLVLDISDPTSPSLEDYYTTPDCAYSVAVSGDYAYVAASLSGLQVIDISDPGSLSLAGSYNTPGDAHAVAIAGDYAFIADGPGGLVILDISDPTAPSHVWSWEGIADVATDVVISGDFAYVTDEAGYLFVVQVFQRTFLIGDNVGRSLAVDALSDTILSASLATTQTGTVTWELSADGGASWQAITPGGGWNPLAVPGTDLVWRSTHVWAPGGNPAVTQLEIDWLYEFPVIDAIADIPNDQGRQVRLTWARSALDAGGGSVYVTEYAVYRKIDDLLSAVPLSSSWAGWDITLGPGPGEDSSPGARLSTPAGDWDFIGIVPASLDDGYSFVVPTLADSTIDEGMYYTTFFVRAFTNVHGTFYDSYPDSGYSVDNLAPYVPEGFMVAYGSGGGNELEWDEHLDGDFQYFRIYRSEDEDFMPEPGNLVHSTTGTSWLDTVEEGWRYYYKITAVDFSGNESGPASPESVTGNDVPSVPNAFTLYQNAPNPFNPSTTIRFDLPKTVFVKLCVYNVKGELIATLVDRHMTEGRREVAWSAKDNRGRAVSSGIYFYRLVAGDFVQTKKMVLLR